MVEVPGKLTSDYHIQNLHTRFDVANSVANLGGGPTDEIQEILARTDSQWDAINRKAEEEKNGLLLPPIDRNNMQV